MGIFVINRYYVLVITTSCGLHLSIIAQNARAKLQLFIYIRKYVFRNSILVH